ncbi:hypothetical protein [Bacillus sp. FJAT-52991]|uniref:Uncharacterized protein n=1 Tax=Bacillus kandeliae TaxID=3129297 RepID=A0ABZ2N316_9BACI
MDMYEVLHRMKAYYVKTGKVMQGELFVREVALQFKEDDVVEGVLLFNDYLDKERKAI